MYLQRLIALMIMLHLSVSAHAEFVELDYKIHQPKKFISQIRSFDSKIVLFHNKGAAISYDKGNTFIDVSLPEFFCSDQLVMTSFENNDLYITNRGFIFKLPFGQTEFIRIIPDEHCSASQIDRLGVLSQITTIAVRGQSIALGWERRYYGAKPTEDNFILISTDGGRCFRAQFLGSDVGENYGFVDFNDGTLYVSATHNYDNSREPTKHFKSLNADFSQFKEITAIENIGWQQSLAVQQKEKSIGNRLIDLNFPPNKISKNDIWHVAYVHYENPHYNCKEQTPGITYEFFNNGNRIYVRSQDAPRCVSYDYVSQTSYFATQTGIWVER